MLYLRSLLLSVMAAGLAQVATASDDGAQVSQEFKLAEAFAGICGQNVGRNDKVAAYARAMKLQELSADMALSLGPQDPNAEFSGWLVKESSGVKYLLGISEAYFNGKQVQTCSVANPDLDPDAVLSEVSKFLELGSLVLDEQSLGQRQRIWKMDNLADNAAIFFTNAVQPKTEGATLALMAPKEGTQ